jgi:hypothetical protein
MRILGSVRGKMIRGCRNVHIEELHNFHSSPNTIENNQVREETWQALDTR